MKSAGYIKLHRKITGWEWYGDPDTFRVFVHLLLMAEYEDRKWHGITIKRGQVLTTRKKLAEETGLTERKVRTALLHLKSTSEVTSTSTNKWTLITIEKYSDYQVIHNQSDQQTDQQNAINRPAYVTKEGKEKKNIGITTARARTREGIVDNSRVVVEEKGFSILLKDRLSDEQQAMLDLRYRHSDDLIREVDDYVRTHNVRVKYPARYIQGYARRCGWPER